jgi:glycosyltransferase involved in cell wall biosynthesis
MRIAMFMPELVPGALGALIYRDLADAISALGHSFECLGSRGGSGPADPWVQPLPLSAAWEHLGALGAPWLRTRRLFAYAAALGAWLRRERRSLDVLHIEIAYPTGAAAALAVALSGWRGVLSVSPMGEDVLVIPRASYGFRRYPVPRRLVDWTMRRARVIRAISPLMLDLVRREWPRTPSQAVPLNVVQRAVDLADEAASARAERRQTARRALEARYPVADRPVALALGRLHPFKAIDVLIESLPSVPQAHLLIAGPSLQVRPLGDVASSLAALARRLGVEQRVTFLGKVPPAEALDLLAGADVLAVPSHLESMNRVCVEAAAVGTPFVVTQTTGVAGWLPGPGVGKVVPAGDPGALATALVDVVGGRFERDDQQTASFVHRFAPERVAADLVEMYEPLVACNR